MKKKKKEEKFEFKHLPTVCIHNNLKNVSKA